MIPGVMIWSPGLIKACFHNIFLDFNIMAYSFLLDVFLIFLLGRAGDYYIYNH